MHGQPQPRFAMIGPAWYGLQAGTRRQDNEGSVHSGWDADQLRQVLILPSGLYATDAPLANCTYSTPSIHCVVCPVTAVLILSPTAHADKTLVATMSIIRIMRLLP